ncbi:MAG: helix-turn-helix domain-containing protein [Streptococcaceae bacterium]|jgi:transcriptional regulator with XRE-family HTH domain|nr:helix-turn-helix domain-containing protein [Streptococcaceae bacterium]
MPSIYENIRFLAEKRKVSLQKMALDLDLSENYFYSLKSKKSPSAANLAAIADYLHTTMDFLQGRESNPYTEQDLKTMAEHAMAFGGKPLSENDRTFLLNFLKTYFDSKKDET